MSCIIEQPFIDLINVKLFSYANFFKEIFAMINLILCRIILAIALTLPLGTMATAQDYDWRTVLSKSLKVQMKINLEFEFSKKRRVPIHFTMGIPFLKGKLITRTRFHKEKGNLGEMMFLASDKKLLEYVTISVGTVGGSTTDERLKRVFSIIEKQVYPSLKPPTTAKVFGGRRSKIGDHPAVEFVSLFDDPKLGQVAARIVGIIAPNNTDVVFVIQQTMRNEMKLNGPDDLAKTFAGFMASSITFQAYRNKAGKLIKF